MTSFKWGAALPPRWVDLLCNKDNLQKLSTTHSQLSTELHWGEYKNEGLHCKLSSAEVCNAHCALFCKGGHYCNAYRPVAKTQLADLSSFPFCNLKKYNLQFDKYVRIMPRSAAGLRNPTCRICAALLLVQNSEPLAKQLGQDSSHDGGDYTEPQNTL